MTRSKIVAWMRLLLPLIALVLLSTMFLLSGKPGVEPEIPFTESDAERQADRQSVVAPELSTVTSDGAELILYADEARPLDGGEGTASQLRLDIRRRDGLTAELVAPEVDIGNDVVTLSGGTRMTTSSGWSIDAESIDASTDRSHISASSGIAAVAPFGKISAERMELRDGEPGKNTAPILNFTEGVRLIYEPEPGRGN